MINVILVDDNLYFLRLIEKTLRNFFEQREFHYEIFKSSEYDETFFKFSNQEMQNKLYLLDIETEKANGIDIARKIRQYDQKAEIIFLTIHDTDEYKNKIVTSNIKSMGFIYKGNLKEEFPAKLEEFLDNIGAQEILELQDGNYFYSVPANDILYVTTNKVSRKTVIKTISGELELFLPLHEVEDMIMQKFNYFIKIHRSYTINILRVISLNTVKKSIIFSNHEEIKTISRNCKSNLLAMWQKYHKSSQI